MKVFIGLVQKQKVGNKSTYGVSQLLAKKAVEKLMREAHENKNIRFKGFCYSHGFLSWK